MNDGAFVSSATFHAAAVSFASAGRRSIRLGIARSIINCSIGWCVGPSSPSAIESCVKTKIECDFMIAAIRTAGFA